MKSSHGIIGFHIDTTQKKILLAGRMLHIPSNLPWQKNPVRNQEYAGS